MFPFGMFPFNTLPDANSWWPMQFPPAQANAQNAVPPVFKAYMDAYNTWFTMMSKMNPWLAGFGPKADK